jgi:hypothetical protein
MPACPEFVTAKVRVDRSAAELTLRDGTRLSIGKKIFSCMAPFFGPDVVDVSACQDIATAVVDGLKQPPEITNKRRVSGGPVAWSCGVDSG